MGEHMTLEHLESALLSIKNKHLNNSTSPLTFELMTHPGYCSIPGSGGCGDGPDDFSQSKEREHEMHVLRSKEWKQVLETQKMNLCSYQHLK